MPDRIVFEWARRTDKLGGWRIWKAPKGAWLQTPGLMMGFYWGDYRGGIIA
jgi:hypothetical protein